MVVLHANWTDDSLWIWGESASAAVSRFRSAGGETEPVAAAANRHPHAAAIGDLQAALTDNGVGSEYLTEDGVVRLVLPGDARGPWVSQRLSSLLELDEHEEDALAVRTEVPAIRIPPQFVLDVLMAIERRLESSIGGLDDAATVESNAHFGHGLRFWVAAANLAVDLLEDQRVVPTLQQGRDGPLRAAWHPWLKDGNTASRAATLTAAMPGIARAAEDDLEHDAAAILDRFLCTVTDRTVRRVLDDESYIEAIEDRDPLVDPHVAWLSGLLDGSDHVTVAQGSEVELMRCARRWLSSLDNTGEGLPFRLLLRIHEPTDDLDPETCRWWLSLHLVAGGSADDQAPEIIDADSLWSRDGAIQGGSTEGACEVLLAELGRASRLYPILERALGEHAPTGLELTTTEIYTLLREHRAVLAEAGIRIEAPSWWDQPASRIGARLLIESDDTPDESTVRGMQSLVRYRWQIALGEQPIALEDFRELASRGVPLVRVGGRWVEIREEDLNGAQRFIDEHPGGEMTLLEALRLAHGAAGESAAVPISGLEASGWVAGILSADDESLIESVPQPKAFRGELRPYQRAGVSWLAFLDRFGLGACLADDMGLGKTIQLIALMLHEREVRPGPQGPSLLVAPMSVLGNWKREIERFGPELTVHLHHGLDRPTGDDFIQRAAEVDLVITTYALVTRDRETLERIRWRRVCLDEAQHIKNPPTKQTAAIRALHAQHRVALTGTPVENRLSELWSIMEFCNPGYLGGGAEFRRVFAIPIERHRERRQAARLRNLVRPFVLRRLKTDPTVIADLPPLVETKHLVPLSAEQTALYEKVVGEMLLKVDRAEGIQRRGLVLSALVKLKQVCNHPGHYLKESSGNSGVSALSSRSGKARRMVEMLEELLSAGDRALIFTQYREMGHMLVAMIRRELDVEPLFLHGGTPSAKRQQLIDRFQDPEGTAPIFVLSLKAGGVGLNLTAANHVFHYDRWWNPAVENQATDRAFRIGQLRTVNVHKLICGGTLEERIDQMIEQKTELASQIIGTGESWLTELSTGQLRDLFALRERTLTEDVTDGPSDNAEEDAA